MFPSGQVMVGPINFKVLSFWQYGSTTVTEINAILVYDIASLVVADFDGDGRADLAQTDGDGWRWVRGGTNTWAPLRGAGGQAMYKNISEVLLGRFTPKPKVPPVQVTPGNRPLNAIRYELEGRSFVIWKGIGTPDTFALWAPPPQEMR